MKFIQNILQRFLQILSRRVLPTIPQKNHLKFLNSLDDSSRKLQSIILRFFFLKLLKDLFRNFSEICRSLSRYFSDVCSRNLPNISSDNKSDNFSRNFSRNYSEDSFNLCSEVFFQKYLEIQRCDYKLLHRLFQGILFWMFSWEVIIISPMFVFEEIFWKYSKII